MPISAEKRKSQLPVQYVCYIRTLDSDVRRKIYFLPFFLIAFYKALVLADAAGMLAAIPYASVFFHTFLMQDESHRAKNFIAIPDPYKIPLFRKSYELLLSHGIKDDAIRRMIFHTDMITHIKSFLYSWEAENSIIAKGKTLNKYKKRLPLVGSLEKTAGIPDQSQSGAMFPEYCLTISS